jgi:hypothetical protein
MNTRAIHNFNGLDVPLYRRIVNHGLTSQETIGALIESLPDSEKEFQKGNIFMNDPEYRSFINSSTDANTNQLYNLLDDLISDTTFHYEMKKPLENISKNSHAGDLRFHSLTVYFLIRLFQPDLVIETGVASGKSSCLILNALCHNKKGRLVSIDLPNKEGNVLSDGAKTHTAGKPVGWMVPDRLRSRWDLRLGDAKNLLPDVLDEFGCPNIFFHDSLHTREHVAFELSSILKHGTPTLIAIDNIDEGAGEALENELIQRKEIAHAYRDLAIWSPG